jgi:hypothetical protein
MDPTQFEGPTETGLPGRRLCHGHALNGERLQACLKLAERVSGAFVKPGHGLRGPSIVFRACCGANGRIDRYRAVRDLALPPVIIRSWPVIIGASNYAGRQATDDRARAIVIVTIVTIVTVVIVAVVVVIAGIDIVVALPPGGRSRGPRARRRRQQGENSEAGDCDLLKSRVHDTSSMRGAAFGLVRQQRQ